MKRYRWNWKKCIQNLAPVVILVALIIYIIIDLKNNGASYCTTGTWKHFFEGLK